MKDYTGESSNNFDVDPLFAGEEELYMRVHHTQFDFTIEELTGAFFKFPDQSADRGKYRSNPEDVLKSSGQECPDHGIAHIRVDLIPTPIPPEKWTDQNGVMHSFRVEHVPNPNNQAHSEIRALRDDSYDKDKTPPAVIRQWMRQALRLQCTVLKKPNKPNTEASPKPLL